MTDRPEKTLRELLMSQDEYQQGLQNLRRGDLWRQLEPELKLRMSRAAAERRTKEEAGSRAPFGIRAILSVAAAAGCAVVALSIVPQNIFKQNSQPNEFNGATIQLASSPNQQDDHQPTMRSLSRSSMNSSIRFVGYPLNGFRRSPFAPQSRLAMAGSRRSIPGEGTAVIPVGSEGIGALTPRLQQLDFGSWRASNDELFKQDFTLEVLKRNSDGSPLEVTSLDRESEGNVPPTFIPQGIENR